jgi:hypothetical protein
MAAIIYMMRRIQARGVAVTTLNAMTTDNGGCAVLLVSVP